MYFQHFGAKIGVFEQNIDIIKSWLSKETKVASSREIAGDRLLLKTLRQDRTFFRALGTHHVGQWRFFVIKLPLLVHSSIDTRGVQIVALRTNLFSSVRLHHQTSILFPQSLDNSLFHKHCLEASMIAVINLLNVNRTQYHQVGRLNHSPPITTGVKLSLTAATRRLFFFF